MSSLENGRPSLSVDEPGKLPVTSHRQLADWYGKREISTDAKVLASGESHCKLLASVFPAAVDLKKLKTGYFSVVSSFNWKLFTTGMNRLGVKKTFDVAKLQLPNSVEMKQSKLWMMVFVDMNEKKFAGVPMEERPGAETKKNVTKRLSQVSLNCSRTSLRRSKLYTPPVARRDSKPIARRSSFLQKQNVSKPVPSIVAKPPVKKEINITELNEIKDEKNEVPVEKKESFVKLSKQEIALVMENGVLKEDTSRVSCNMVNTEDLELTGEASALTWKEMNPKMDSTPKNNDSIDKSASETTVEFSIKEASEEFLKNASSMFSSIGNVDASTGKALLTPGITKDEMNKEGDLTDTPIPGKGMIFVRNGRGTKISPINELKKDTELKEEMIQEVEEDVASGMESIISPASKTGSEIDPFNISLPPSSPEADENSPKNQEEKSPLNTGTVVPKRGNPYDFKELRKALEFED